MKRKETESQAGQEEIATSQGAKKADKKTDKNNEYKKNIKQFFDSQANESQ